MTGQSAWEPASNTTLLVDGNVSVTTDWFAGGVTINRGDNLTATVTGDIDVSGWEWVSGVSVNSGDNASFSAGNVRVEGEDFVTGVEFNVGNYGSLALGSLEVSAFDRFALAEGLVVTGNDHLTVTANDVAVKAGSDAWGVHLTGSGWLLAGDHTTLQLDGSLQVTSTSGSAYGIDLYSGDGLSLGVTGTTVVSGAREVTAVNVTTLDDAEVTLGDVTADGGTRALGLGLVAGDSGRFAVGDVTAIGRSSRSNATGVEADLLEDASLTVGDVTVEGDALALGVGLWAGDFGRIAVGDVIAVGRSAWSKVTGADVHLGDDVSFTIGDVTATGGASAMGALIAAGYDTSVVVDGSVTVSAMGGDADGIQVDLSPNSTMRVEGAIVVTSSDAIARGVSIVGANDFSVAVNDVTVEGADAMGVYANVGGSWGMTLEVDGDVTVVGTRDSGWAEGITMIGGNELTAAVTGDVLVTGGEDVSGVWIVGEDRTTATLAGVTVAGAGEGYMVGVRFGAYDDATLTIQGDVEAIGEGDQSWVDGLWVTGYDNLTVNTKAITVAGGDQVIGVDLRGFSGFPAGDQVTLTIDGELKATASSSGNALGMDLFTGDGLDVSVSGAIEVSGGNLAYGASIMTLNEARVAMGDVTAESDSESVGVYLVAADNGQLKLGKVTAVSQNEDATGLDLWVGDDTQINVESIAADAHGEAAGIMLQHAGTGTAINLADGFLVRSYGEHGSAVGLWLDDFDAIDVNLAGESTVRADASAIGLEIGSDAPGREAVVRNFGLIEVSGDDATGIRLSVRERAAIDNSGVIDVAGGIAVDARASTGVTVLQNEGVIMGDIYLGVGDDLFVVHSAGRIDGEIDLGDGDDGATLHAGSVVGPLDGGDGHDVLRLLGASGSVPSSTPGVQKLALEVASEVTASNFEQVVIEGGRWAFGEGTDLDNVELTGGILGGDTVLSGSLLNVSGTVAPGNSFGIVTIAGDYTQSKDALLSIEVGPTTDPQAGVNHDQLIVGGTARFEPGTTIQIVSLPGIYPDRTRYVIVDGDLEDFDPDDVDLDFPMLFLNGSLEEGSLVLLVETVPFESIAESGRRQAVASALSEAMGGSETELDDLHGWLHQLISDQKREALKAFDSISGEVYSYLPVMTARGVESVAEATTRSIDNSPSGPRRQVWAAKYGGPGWIPRESDAPGARFVTRGLVVGGDLISWPSLRVGLVAGGGSETLTVKAADSDLLGHSSNLGAYGRYDWGEGHLTLFAGFGKTSYVSDRHVVFGADVRRAEAEFDAGSGVVWVEVGYEPVKRGKFSFEPMVSMGWLSSRQTQIKENGAGNLSLTVEPYHFSPLTDLYTCA